MLRIELLGHCAAFADGAPFDLAPMGTSVRLWHYLLLQGAEALPRQHIARELWPEEDDKIALANLRRQLHTLIASLPKAPEAQPWVVADRSTLQWNPDADYALDLAEYRARLGRTAAGDAGPTTRYTLAELEGAAVLYRGDLLPEAYDDWVLVEREHLRQLHGEVLFRLVGLQATLGHLRQAIAMASRLVVHDPLLEEGHRLLIGLRYLAGDRGAALHAYGACQGLLDEELGVEPLPSTSRLAAAVRAGEAPERILRLLAADLPPGTRVADLLPGRPGHNLPPPVSTFIGRQTEVKAVRQMLGRHRLTTLMGPAGCGKTRLALEVAGRMAGAAGARDQNPSPDRARDEGFPDGLWWVDLAAVTDSDQVAPAVAVVLGARPVPRASAMEAMARHVAGKALLVVLDNCEHVAAASAAVAQCLLRAGSGVRLLATSREILGVMGEATWSVPPLSCAPAEAGARTSTVAAPEAPLLFEDRARQRRAGFRLGDHNAAAVAEVCRRLDGLPLAIELAAAQVQRLTVAQLAEGLPDSLGRPGTADPGDGGRHGTLQAAIDWSHDLLSDPEQRFLRRLAVFSGGCTLEAATAVCGGDDVATGAEDLLSSLVDKSLVTAGVAGGVWRYRLLDTMRHYAGERLADAGEEEAIRDRHAAYFLDVAEEAAPNLIGSEQLDWLDRLETEHPNLLGAVAWCARPGGDTAGGRRLAVALWRFWRLHSHLQVGRRWLEELAPAPRDIASPVDARLVWAAASFALDSHDLESSSSRLEGALDACRRMGDREGEAWALNDQGVVARRRGDLDDARALYEKSLALKVELGRTTDAARTLNNLGELAWADGDVDRAAELYQQALALDGVADGGLDQQLMAGLAYNLGEAKRLQGDLPGSADLCRRSLALAADLGDRVATARALAGLGGALAGQGRARRGATLLGAARALQRSVGTVLDAANAADFEAMASVARAGLGGADWQAAWDRGLAMTRDDAVALGLEA